MGVWVGVSGGLGVWVRSGGLLDGCGCISGDSGCFSGGLRRSLCLPEGLGELECDLGGWVRFSGFRVGVRFFHGDSGLI